MVNILIDGRPAELLDRKQRGIGVYTQLLIKSLEKHNFKKITYHHLPIRFDKYLKRYTPKNKVHLLLRKAQFLLWILDNKLLDRKISTETIFHSTDQLYIPAGHYYKRVVTVHDIIPTIFPKKYFDKMTPVMKNIYTQSINELPKVEKIITVSHFTKADIIKRLNIDENKITVIHEAPAPQFRVIPKGKCKKILYNDLNLPANYILFIGGIDSRKNLTGVIEVFKRLTSQFDDLYLFIAGSDFQAEDDLNKNTINLLLRKYNLEDKTISLGYIDNETLACLYNEAKLLLFPSFYEGFGLPLVEAMACGCPIVASNRTSIPEVVEDVALLINPSCINEMVKATSRILKDNNLSQGMSKKGLKRSKLFSWDKAAKETIKIYQSLV